MSTIKKLKTFLFLFGLFLGISGYSQEAMINSPDANLKVNFYVENGRALYEVLYKDKMMLEKSPLGLITNEADFTKDLSFLKSEKGEVSDEYSIDRIKQSQVSYQANKLKVNLANAGDKEISIVFQVSNNDIAFRYEIPAWGETRACLVEKEVTGYDFPDETTSFLSPMMQPMGGFARTAPSYESGYEVDVPMDTNTSETGYVFPGLFKIGGNGWVLLSETGVRSLYNASHLSRFKNGIYTVEYPDPAQNNGFGSTGAQIGLPGHTPWRTITVGESLKPIVETTISYDVVDQLYEPSQDYEYGKGTWSWIVWQDDSMNYDDQVKYIDLAAAMGFEYILIDAWWDERIGYEKMEELIKYADSKDVDVFLWYNSNGIVNDAFMTPRNKMNTSIARKKEMKWLKEVGVKGIKVDFFGGDKQETMRLYENVLSDANDYGLMVIFHGATLPRGWERMYPNFVGSEAVLASEMLVFVQDVRNKEAVYASLHPFIRNTVASMEFGGIMLNKFLNKGNKEGQERLTTDAFQLATGVLFQNPVQMFALTPNNLEDVPKFGLDFIRGLPTTWDETVFIDGYPGKFSVLARRHDQTWYVAGVNAEMSLKKLDLELPMLAGKTVTIYSDNKKKKTYSEEIKIPASGKFSVDIQPNGGFVIKN
ncbi:glycoside hydrolase family 97 protein [Gramella sp. GC03-9]|uniref:Glycoside hydrolase family 97 protein n=1 Tax=Christiangramia oceanisediminis TaxID=2920386 RepID=A0A9X2I498_9FLAO|nr:glycoside hydrolase family 97 protein [Gramella oceanisediminis]MCP9199097.1 glycoside hydrolase family 97 protein [Gramella oceanisediminis]